MFGRKLDEVGVKQRILREGLVRIKRDMGAGSENG